MASSTTTFTPNPTLNPGSSTPFPTVPGMNVGNSSIGNGLSINPATGNIGQGSSAGLLASTLGGGYPANVSTANALTSSLPSSSTTSGLLNSHPAIVAAQNTHPTSLTTNPDGTVKATYAPPTTDTSGGTSNPNANYTAGVTQTTNQPTSVSQLSNVGTSTPGTAKAAPSASGLLSTVAGFSQPDSQLSDLKSKMDALDADFANKTAEIQNTPSDLNFQTGRLQAIQSEYNTAKAALNSNYQSLLQERGQNIGAAENALSTANQQTQAPFGTPLYNASTNTVTLGGQPLGANNQLSPQAQLQSIAQAVANKGMSYDTAYTQIANAFSPNVANTLLPTIQALPGQSGFSPITNNAIAAGTGAAITQAGINAGTAAQALGKAQPIAQNLDALIQQNGINPTDITYANNAINFVKSNFGTPAQQAAITEFGGQLNDLASTLAPILGIPGGATTDFKTSLGQSIVNGLQNGQSVSQSVQYFISQAQQGAAGAYTGGTNPIQTINTPTTGGSVTTSVGNFVKNAQGQWEVQ